MLSSFRSRFFFAACRFLYAILAVSTSEISCFKFQSFTIRSRKEESACLLLLIFSEREEHLQNLLRYINDSKDENVTDDNTDKLNNIVRHTKNKPGIGIKYMKSWERDRELIRDERRRTEEAEQRAEEERQRAEKEKQRAEEEKQRAEEEKQRADNLQAELDAAKAELARLKNNRA